MQSMGDVVPELATAARSAPAEPVPGDGTPVREESGSQVTRDLSQVAAVADGIVELMRSFNRAKARMLQLAEHDVEWSARFILRRLKTEGAMRAGALAECMQTDPSTVSRQVAVLVRDGLLERRADPEDGRASLLVLTPAADEVLLEHDRIRTEYFGAMLQDWDETQLATFAAQLHRFTRAYEAADDHWTTNRPATRAGRNESTD